MIASMHKMHVNEINIKSKVYNYSCQIMAWRNRLKQRKHLKKYKQRNNACNMASYKMVD